MSLYIMVLIMLGTGLIGGFVNYLLPANKNTAGTFIQSAFHCIILGTGATILIPLFLEIAQSKLLDNIHLSWEWQSETCNCSADTVQKTASPVQKDDNVKAPPAIDSPHADAGAPKDQSDKKNLPEQPKKTAMTGTAAASCCVPVKTYFLFAAYCFLAAAAGFRFINNLMDSVLKDKQIASLKQENTAVQQEKDKIEAEKEKAEKEKTKLTAQNIFYSKAEEQQAIGHALMRTASIKSDNPLILPSLGPVTHPDDPQKGRFGGKSENNNRRLKASVTSGTTPGFYKVSIWVESLNADKPLTDDVIFYLHDSFRPSVVTVRADEFRDGRAVYDNLQAYGAFTVGAVADNGGTLLELDLSQQQEFPAQFRER